MQQRYLPMRILGKSTTYTTIIPKTLMVSQIFRLFLNGNYAHFFNYTFFCILLHLGCRGPFLTATPSKFDLKIHFFVFLDVICDQIYVKITSNIHNIQIWCEKFFFVFLEAFFCFLVSFFGSFLDFGFLSLYNM